MRRPLTVLISLALLLAVPFAAVAKWSTPASGTGRSKAATIAAPTNFNSSSVTSSSVTLSWTAPTNPAPAGYVLTRDGGAPSSACSSLGAAAVSCTDAGLSSSTTYNYVLKAVLGGWSSPTVPKSVLTSAPGDTTPPTVASISVNGASPTKATSLAWTVTFSEPVNGVTAGNFALATANLGGTAPSISTVSGTAPTATWIVNASATGTTGANNGSIGLNLSSTTNVKDVAGNNLSATTPVTGATYVFDTTGPTAASVSTTNHSGGVAGKPEVSDTLVLTFSEVMDPSTLYSGWSTGSTADVTNAIVTFNDSPTGNGTNQNNDSLTISVPSATVNLGTGINMEGHVVSVNGGSFAFTATLHYAVVSGQSVVTVTLNGLNSGGSSVGTAASGTVTWSPVAAAHDEAGNLMSTATKPSSLAVPF